MTHLIRNSATCAHRAAATDVGRSLFLLLAVSAGLAVTVGNGLALAAAPPLTAVDSWAEWADGRAPLDVAAGVVRIVVLALLVYLWGIAIAHTLAALTPGRRTCSIVDRVTPRLLAALLAGSVLGAGPAAGAVETSTSDRSEDIAPGAGATMQIIDRATDVAETPLPETQLPWADEPPQQPLPSPLPRPTASPQLTAATLPTELPAAPESIYTVVAGDHLWGIAEQHLGGLGVTDPGALATYWQQLIDANRHRLADPENPDLIHPGQELELPPLP